VPSRAAAVKDGPSSGHRVSGGRDPFAADQQQCVRFRNAPTLEEGW